MSADVTRPASLQLLAKHAPEILVYCVAADAQTDDSYRSHYVDGFRNVLDAMSASFRMRHVFFVSSSRVYGQASDDYIDDVTPASPADFGGIRLLEGEAILRTLSCPSTALRLSGIYGPGRHRLLNLARQPQNWPLANTWSNRIHIGDAAAFIAHLIQSALQGATIADRYLVTDGNPVPHHEVLRWLAGQLGVNISGVVAPSPHGGKRLDNIRMRATGFVLRYPDYRAGYGEMIARESAA